VQFGPLVLLNSSCVTPVLLRRNSRSSAAVLRRKSYYFFHLLTYLEVTIFTYLLRGHLIVPRTRLQFGKRAFAFAGLTAWNSAESINTFKRLLKSFLSSVSYPGN